jgi:WD40 repeat protein
VASAEQCCGIWLNRDEYVFIADPHLSREIWSLRERDRYLWRTPPVTRQLTFRSSQPALENLTGSPEGSTIYALGHAVERLMTFDSSRADFVPYLNGIRAFSVSFSPDGRSVAYIDTPDHELWLADADGGHARPLVSAPWSVDALEWRHDGRQLAIRAREDERHHTKIYLISPAGGRPQPLEKSDVEQGSPTWSSDGTRIAFGDVPDRYGNTTGSECLHVYDLRTGTMSDIEGSVGFWSGRWSPDGRYIAATRIGDRALMLYDVASSRWHDLNLRHAGELTWFRDGTIFVEPERPEHWALRVHVPDGRAERLVDLTDESLHRFGAGITLDGRPLFLRTAVDIFALRLERK